MAQASVSGKGGTQITLSIHGQTLDPLNIGPAKQLWHLLGEALDDAERNRDSLVSDGASADSVENADDGVEASPSGPNVAEGAVVGVSGTQVQPEPVEPAPDPAPETPNPNPMKTGTEAGRSPEEAVLVDHADQAPPPRDEADVTPFSKSNVVDPEEAAGMTKAELADRLEAEGVAVKSAAKKDELVALASHDYESLTKAQLHDLLDGKGVSYPASASKADLVKLAEEG